MTLRTIIHSVTRLTDTHAKEVDHTIYSVLETILRFELNREYLLFLYECGHIGDL